MKMKNTIQTKKKTSINQCELNNIYAFFSHFNNVTQIIPVHYILM